MKVCHVVIMFAEEKGYCIVS